MTTRRDSDRPTRDEFTKVAAKGIASLRREIRRDIAYLQGRQEVQSELIRELGQQLRELKELWNTTQSGREKQS